MMLAFRFHTSRNTREAVEDILYSYTHGYVKLD